MCTFSRHCLEHDDHFAVDPQNGSYDFWRVGTKPGIRAELVRVFSLIVRVSVQLADHTNPAPEAAAAIVHATFPAALGWDVVLSAETNASHGRYDCQVDDECQPNDGSDSACISQNEQYHIEYYGDDGNDHACAFVAAARSSARVELETLHDLSQEHAGTAATYPERAAARLTATAQVGAPASFDAGILLDSSTFHLHGTWPVLAGAAGSWMSIGSTSTTEGSTMAGSATATASSSSSG
eukprot:CAMPEP_0119557614 /NCGR_PEP_ID=MMETSP1352-20130426/9236_1 /TAXON_ID=265584 /ORGANISM="Stauroneis constricta, Strain CCMP1120" /LENGTH=238 /DNA_ID=CAMNT_0007604751 /DNA_START=113 /DNA_END=831 /DNA_ORIENTATION=-